MAVCPQPTQINAAGPPNMENVITMKSKNQAVRRNRVTFLPIATKYVELQVLRVNNVH